MAQLPRNLSAEKTAEIERIISSAVEKSRDDDAESIITSDRYEWIAGVMAVKAPKKLSSFRLTVLSHNRILGLPILLLLCPWCTLSTISTVASMLLTGSMIILFDKGFHVLGIGDAEYNQAKDDLALTTMATD